MKSHWHYLADNPQAITNIYTDVPDLVDIILVGIEILSGSSMMKVRCELNRYPDNSPPRWGKQNNGITIELIFYQPQVIALAGETYYPKISTEIRRLSSGKIRANAVGDNFIFSLISEHFMIGSFQTYIIDEKTSSYP